MDNIHNKIANICLSHFDSLPKSGKPTNNQWTVLSCIVLQSDSENFEVVALGTGSKCIGRSSYSRNGDILNDSHGEIICRRAFLRYLYSQFRTDSDIFNCAEKYQLKSNVKFHFFTTHVPCGDAAIFPKTDDNDYGSIINDDCMPPEKKQKIDIFRTGAKCLQNDIAQDLRQTGAGYHVLGAVRTKPGRGDPTDSVSCSDKIAKWCYLGLQGAVLGLLIDKPIYLDSFTIVGGTPFCENALGRALYSRIGNIELNQPYSNFIKMKIGQSNQTFKFCKDNSKSPCPNSIIWSKIDHKKCLEVSVNGKKLGVTKKTFNSRSARVLICRMELFNNFQMICKNISPEITGLTYRETKSKNIPYQEAWNTLKTKFKIWTIKYNSLSDFCSDFK